MNRPDYTKADDLRRLLPAVLNAPVAGELITTCCETVGTFLAGSPLVAPWYHLPIISLAGELLTQFARSPYYNPVPGEVTKAQWKDALSPGLSDDHRKLLLRQWLLRKVPGTIAADQVMALVDATYTLWAEADGATEDCWTKLVQVVQQATELGLAAASF